MSDLSLTLQLTLSIVLVVLGILSLQLVSLAVLRVKSPPRRLRMPLLPDEALPEVLVQLPVCDEGGLALEIPHRRRSPSLVFAQCASSQPSRIRLNSAAASYCTQWPAAATIWNGASG